MTVIGSVPVTFSVSLVAEVAVCCAHPSQAVIQNGKKRRNRFIGICVCLFRADKYSTKLGETVANVRDLSHLCRKGLPVSSAGVLVGCPEKEALILRMNNLKQSTVMELKIEPWGKVPYAESWDRQTEYFNALVAAKQAGEPYVNRIILVEHPHVYTLGRSGKDANMLLGEAQLEAIGAALYHIDRGGDITYHGPGQLVCYPILNLEDFHLGLKEYIHVLEEAVIRVCASYGIEAGRVKGATGVWLAIGTPRERKICAIGVRSSHYVTMHGLAFNVNTDLRYFSYIHPCGFIDKGVTSLQQEVGHEVPLEEVTIRLKTELLALLQSAAVKE